MSEQFYPNTTTSGRSSGTSFADVQADYQKSLDESLKALTRPKKESDKTEESYQNAKRLAENRRQDDGGHTDFLDPTEVPDRQSNDPDYQRGRQAAQDLKDRAAKEANQAKKGLVDAAIDGLKKGADALIDRAGREFGLDQETVDALKAVPGQVPEVAANIVAQPLIDLAEGDIAANARERNRERENFLIENDEALTRAQRNAQIEAAEKLLAGSGGNGPDSSNEKKGNCPTESSRDIAGKRCGGRAASVRGATSGYDS